MPDHAVLPPRLRRHRLALVALLPLALAACEGGKTPIAEAPSAEAAPAEAPTAEAAARAAGLTLGPEASGTAVDVATGDTLTVALGANATTGYAWMLADSSALAPALVATGDAYTPDDAGTPPRVGVGGTYRLRLRAAAPGEAVLRLHYRRSFEPATVAPADSFAVRVRVSGRP